MSIEMPRSDIIKMPMIGYGASEQEPHRVLPAVNLTLDNLKLEYLDLKDDNDKPLWYTKEWILETWREMVKLRDLGKAKYIGVSNFTCTKLQWLIDDGVTPSNNQENGIVPSAYSPIGSPANMLTRPPVTEFGTPMIIKDPVIVSIAEKHKASPAQVLIKWGIDRGYPVIVKSSSESRMKENLESLKINLTDDDIKSIKNIETQCRLFHFKAWYTPEHTPEEFFDGDYYN